MPPRGTPPRNFIDRDPRNIGINTQTRVLRLTRRTPGSIKWWRAHAPNLLALIGLCFAASGAYLALRQPPVPVFKLGDNIHVGAAQLVPSGATLYQGDAAMIIIDRSSRGNINLNSTASTYAYNKDVAGRCQLIHIKNAAQIHEDCSFWIGVPITGPASFTSSDIFDTLTGDRVWHRHYSDGVDVQIFVPVDASVTPVPFPVGR